MFGTMKREFGSSTCESTSGYKRVETDEANLHDEAVVDRRFIRARYFGVKTRIIDQREDLTKTDSDGFQSIINQVKNLHEQVQKPREQVADAEALLDITSTLLTSVKAHDNNGITPSDFVTCLLRDFGTNICREDSGNVMLWKDIGVAVSHFFRRGPGCCTMLEPMNATLKQRKPAGIRRHGRQIESSCPEELDDIKEQERPQTNKDMSTMFDILKKYRSVKLENLVLNRKSFAQTVENIFALSFLVKDGRAEIKVNEKGCHLVSPRNAPAASAISSGKVCYSHFVFRFDYKDWKLMTSTVRVGEELMPHRGHESSSQAAACT